MENESVKKYIMFVTDKTHGVEQYGFIQYVHLNTDGCAIGLTDKMDTALHIPDFNDCYRLKDFMQSRFDVIIDIMYDEERSKYKWQNHQ